MPHISVKMFPGRTQEQKQALTQALTKAMIEAIGAKPETISVGIEDVAKDAWDTTVAKPEIQGKPATIFRQPGTP
jgi:4-oxalocrotonate tautomerase